LSEPESSDGQQPESTTESYQESTPDTATIKEKLDGAAAEAEDEAIAEEATAEAESEEKAEEVEETPKTEPETDGNSHLFAVKTTGGQEKIVMRLLEARIKMEKINIQSAVLLSDFKGYVVVEAKDPSAMFDAIQGIRHVRGHLRGELTYDDIDKYLIKKSTVSELAVENTVEIIGGPFKGMKATITRLDQEKEEATVILLDATYQLPVTVDANYLKLVPA
jgi:transcriptional antiterminator NusG